MSDQLRCDACGYMGTIDTYHPSLSMWNDCRCPQCGSTQNEHNREYQVRMSKAMGCKHKGTLVDVPNRQDLLKCTDCGSTGLAAYMRSEAQ